MDRDVKERIKEAVDEQLGEFIDDFKRRLTDEIESILGDVQIDELVSKDDLEEWAKDNGWTKDDE